MELINNIYLRLWQGMPSAHLADVDFRRLPVSWLLAVWGDVSSLPLSCKAHKASIKRIKYNYNCLSPYRDEKPAAKDFPRRDNFFRGNPPEKCACMYSICVEWTVWLGSLYTYVYYINSNLNYLALCTQC